MLEFDVLITNGMPIGDDFGDRFEKGWELFATVPAVTIHPYAMKNDMATIFTRYVN